MTRFAAVSGVFLMLLVLPRPSACQDVDHGQQAVPAPRIYHSLVFIDRLDGVVMTGGHSAVGWTES